MYRQSVMMRALVLSVVLLGALAILSTAHAVTNHAGAICKNYFASEAALIDYNPHGTRSLKTSATAIICPLTRHVVNTNGTTVFVDITHSGFFTTSCTAYSFDFSGFFLGSVSASFTGTGFHEFALNLNGNGLSRVFSDYSVLCVIPGNAGGILNSIDTSE
jgi:hypothetical protein